MTIRMDVMEIGINLSQIISSNEDRGDDALNLLKKLQDLPIDMYILEKTRIGMIVNNLRKATSNEEVRRFCKSMIKSWRESLIGKKNEKLTTNCPSKTNESTECDNVKGFESRGDDKEKDEKQSVSSSLSITTDTFRLKIRELLANALRQWKIGEDSEELSSSEGLANELEEAIFNEFRERFKI